MNKRLSIKDYIYIGSMLFGIMFGAGNLIFPIHMGQEAGSQVWSATLGFLRARVSISWHLGLVRATVSFSPSSSI